MIRALVCLVAAVALCGGDSWDAERPPGTNFAAAQARAWIPDPARPVRAAVLLLAGYNQDGRGLTGEAAWRDFARPRDLALVGVRLTDRAELEDIESYYQPARGSGQAVLDLLADLARRSGRPELAEVPLVLWGHSAGGQFAYEFACWKPERTVAFTINKGGFYFTHLAPLAAREIPAVAFLGERDAVFRNESIRGIFACNRRTGARWALAVEPGAGHEPGRTRELAQGVFAAALAQRLPGPGATVGALRPAGPGRIVDLRTGGSWDGTDRERTKAAGDIDRTVWLPDAATEAAWRRFTAGPASASVAR